ncbi:MAG TPA: hypothetical protein VLT47_12310 [Anaeromyxobacteraceae bacterium]|nr:hypothetical protein [Anaeromyxobacteraceae bacterium]
MRTTRFLLAVTAALSAAPALADTVEATSTTYLNAGKQPRNALPGQAPDLVDVMPVTEVVTVAARGIRNPVFDDLEVVVSTWGSYDLRDRRWDNGTDGNLTGDVMTGYVRGRLLDRRLTLRVGRENVSLGAGRVASIDGGDLALRLPLGIGLTAYAGAPVAQRFSARDALRSWNALGGDLAYGGRASIAVPLPLAFLRLVELGASAAFVDDGGEAVRRDAGVDARLRLFGDFALNAYALWAVEDERLAELNALASWHPAHAWFVTADFRRSAPDLMLSRTSILSVFADSTRDEVGGGVRWEVLRSLEVGVDYHALLEPGEDGTGTELGHDLAVRGDYSDGPIRAGAEVDWLKGADNGYVGARFYVRRELGALFAAAEVLAWAFDEAINSQDYAANASATLGYKLGKAWTASLTGRAGATPYMEQQVDVMAKLAYNQTYRVREVR